MPISLSIRSAIQFNWIQNLKSFRFSRNKNDCSDVWANKNHFHHEFLKCWGFCVFFFSTKILFRSSHSTYYLTSFEISPGRLIWSLVALRSTKYKNRPGLIASKCPAGKCEPQLYICMERINLLALIKSNDFCADIFHTMGFQRLVIIISTWIHVQNTNKNSQL